MTKDCRIFHCAPIHPSNDIRISKKQLRSLCKLYPNISFTLICNKEDELVKPTNLSIIALGSNNIHNIYSRLKNIITCLNHIFLIISSAKQTKLIFHFHNPDSIVLLLFAKLYGHLRRCTIYAFI